MCYGFMLKPFLRVRRHFAAFPGRRSGDDPWSVLGVSPTDDLDTCKSAFRRLALSLHPDVSSDPADAEQFAAAVEAYEAITSGVAESDRPRRAGPRGVRTVGGVLVISIDVLKKDPAYQVFAVRLRLDGERSDGIDSAVSSSDGTESAALSAETVHEVQCSAFDSVADLRMQLQAELDLPERLRHGIRHSGGHELIYHAQLLGEHLFLADYEIEDGDTLYFAVRQR